MSKHYGRVRAVDGVSLEVAPGEIYALLGLNGAGKTTLIRMMLSLVHPSSGSIELMGRSSGSPGVWADVGYLVETPSAYPELTVRENLEVVRRLRRLPDAGSVGEAIARFGLEPYADRRARNLSLGNLQRLGLAKAMLHRPSLVVLDEPVNGLDPAGVVEIRTLLSGLAREHGMTVFLSSHILGEVARLATRVGVLHQGRLVDEFTTADLARRVDRQLVVATRDDARAVVVLDRGRAVGLCDQLGPAPRFGVGGPEPRRGRIHPRAGRVSTDPPDGCRGGPRELLPAVGRRRNHPRARSGSASCRVSWAPPCGPRP